VAMAARFCDDLYKTTSRSTAGAGSGHRAA
jgi:hypothetical protein